MKILYIAHGGIGDAVLQFPVLSALRLAHAGATVDWFGRPDAGLLAKAVGLVDSVAPGSKVGYDLVIEENSAVVDPMSAEPLFSQRLRFLGLPPTVDFHLGSLKAAVHEKVVAMFTGASTPGKLWPDDRWCELASKIPQGYSILLPIEKRRACSPCGH